VHPFHARNGFQLLFSRAKCRLRNYILVTVFLFRLCSVIGFRSIVRALLTRKFRNRGYRSFDEIVFDIVYRERIVFVRNAIETILAGSHKPDFNHINHGNRNNYTRLIYYRFVQNIDEISPPKRRHDLCFALGAR